MNQAFRDRVAAERTRALAQRGSEVGRDRLPPRLLCRVGTRHVALPIGMVASIRPFACHPVPLIAPAAANAMLGLAVSGRSLVSVLDLGRLLRFGDAEPPAGGSMILLRDRETPTALRVDGVLGVVRLLPAAEPGRALLAPGDAPSANQTDAEPPLIVLLDADALLASIDRLDHA